MRTKRKGIALMLIICMLVLIFGTVPVSAATAVTTKGWTVNKTYSTDNLTSSQKRLFEKATKGLTGVEYEPILLLGRQVVAGTKYAYLCKATTVTKKAMTSLKVVVIFKHPNGRVQLAAINDLDISNMITAKCVIDDSIPSLPCDGGWNINTKVKAVELPGHLEKKLERAAKKLTGKKLTPLAYLGKKTTSVRYYKILCLGETTGRYPVKTLDVVTMYVNANGVAKIKYVEQFSLSAYANVFAK